MSIDHSVFLIPQTAVPLNTTDCMCQSLQDAANRTANGITCTNNTHCDGLHCVFQSGNNVNFNVDTVILPCHRPPGFNLTIIHESSGQTVLMQYFNSSSSETSLFNFPLHVMVVHKPHSIIIKVRMPNYNSI